MPCQAACEINNSINTGLKMDVSKHEKGGKCVDIMEILRNAKTRFREEKRNRGMESRLPQAETGTREQKTSGKYLGIVDVKKGRDILLEEEFDSRLQSKSNPPKAATRSSESVKTYIVSQRDMRLVFFLSLCLQQEMELIDDTKDSWKNLPFYPTGIAKCVKITTDEPLTLSTVDAMPKNPEGNKGKSFPCPLLPLQNQDHLWCNGLVQLCLHTLHRSKRAVFEATCFWLWRTGSIKEETLREVTANDQLFSACVQRLYLLNRLFRFLGLAKQLSLIESDRTRYFVHCAHHLDYSLMSEEDYLYRVEVGNEKRVLQVARYPESTTPELCRPACDDANQHDGVEKVSDQEKAECQNGQSDTVQDHERPKTEEKKRNLRKRKVKKHWKQRRACYATNKSVVVGSGVDGRKGRSDSEESVERSAENLTSDDFLPPQTNQKPQEASPETSQDNKPLSEDEEPSQPFSEQRIETAHIPEAISVSEQTVIFLEKDTATDVGEKDAVTDIGEKDAVTDIGGKDAVTDIGGKDAVTDNGGKDAVTDIGEKDAVTDKGKDSVLHLHIDSGKPRLERFANNTTTTTTTTPLYVLSSPKSSLTYSYTQPISSCLTSSKFTTRHTPRVSRRMMLLDQIRSELTSHRRELEVLTSDRESFHRAIGETSQWAYRQLTGLMTKL